jgi:hypothetical protein
MHHALMHRFTRALIWATATAIVEVAPPILLELTGRTLVTTGRGMVWVGQSMQRVGHDTVNYSQRQRQRGYRTLQRPAPLA